MKMHFPFSERDIIKKLIFFSILFICIAKFVYATEQVSTLSKMKKSAWYVNIYNKTMFSEYIYTLRGEVLKEKKYNSKRHGNMSVEFEGLLGSSLPIKQDFDENINMKKINGMHLQSILGKCEMNSLRDIPFVGSMKKRTKYLKNLIHSIDGRFAVYKKKWSSSGLILDFKGKVVITPFCGNIVKHVSWSTSSKYVAFATSEKDRKYSSLIIIYDVRKRQIKTQFKTKQRIESIVWGKDDSTLGALTKSSVVSKSPFNILKAIAGHPVSINKFYLELFSFVAGKNINILELGSFNDANGRLVFIK